MADKTNCEDLACFRKSIRKANLTKSILETPPFLVVAIHRYLSDPKHWSQIGVTGGQGQLLDVIQLTVSDYTHKMKVVLSSELNRLVQACKLQVGHTVSIKKCRLHFDETDLSGGNVVIVEDIEVTGFKELEDPAELSNLKWCDDCCHLEQMDLPMTSSRGYYTSVWSSMEMHGNIWKTQVPTVNDLGSTRVEDIYSIKDLAKKWSTVKIANPVLLVKVLQKSRMIHYAKPGKNDKWPFQAHLMIGDKTGACTAVLWNAMCPDFYFCIQEGTILLLKKFTVKKSFQLSTRFRPVVPSTQVFDIDINLNSHHPESEVRIFDPHKLPDEIELPPLHHNFATRKQAGCLPNNYVCDITGVVTYVGRYEREPMNNKFGVDSGGFWVRRWIQLIDETSPKPFYLQLYRIAEGMTDLDIHPGIKLVCSHVRLVQNLDHLVTSHTSRLVFLTTTAESQISVLDPTVYKELKTETVIERLWKWSSTRDCKIRLADSTVGGYINFPPLPDSVESLKTSVKDAQVVASGDWETVFTGLSYRENRQILVQATMVHIKLHLEHCTDHSPRRSASKKSRPSDVEVILDPDLYQNEQGFRSLGSSYMDEEVSFPVRYSTNLWPALKSQLQFPFTDLYVGQNVDLADSEIEYLKVPYFTITWSGLNSQVLLHTHLLYGQTLKDKASVLDILAGTSHAQTTSEKGNHYRDLQEVMLSAKDCVDKRFLVVLDCYQGNTEYTEIMVNRAIPTN